MKSEDQDQRQHRLVVHDWLTDLRKPPTGPLRTPPLPKHRREQQPLYVDKRYPEHVFNT